MINPKRTESQKTIREGEKEQRLIQKVKRMIGYWDSGEETRRRSDRMGARIFYGHHWGVAMPDGRAAITVNIAMSLLAHKVAIQTKQDPIPVIEPDDVGDAEAARLMRSVVMRRWVDDNMKIKTRRGLLLAGATRTCAGKVVWDPECHNGAGDTTTDIIPGWRMILDNRASDPDQMEYCGDRAPMPRARAMLLYPEAADKLRGPNEAEGYRQEKGGGTFIAQEGVSGPFGPRIAPAGSPTLVNGKPVITAFAGEPAGGTGEDLVEIIELYYKDRTMVKAMETVRDHLGNPKTEIVRHPDDHPLAGEPVFTPLPDEMHEMGGIQIPIPAFKIETKEIKIERLTFKYPNYRRTTIMVPDGSLIEDIAWDHPLPYFFFNDSEPLEGMLSRGGILSVQQLQSFLNITVSSVCNIIRMGEIKAFFAGAQSGLATDIIIARPGQIIPVGDPAQITEVPNSPMSDQFFKTCDMITNFMERVMGATGVMQGEAQGRMDSASGYDTLAEIGGARIVEGTQRLEVALARWAMLVGHFAQKYYSERHSVAVEDATGNLTYERAFRPDLQGSLSYKIAVGSTLAWSESALRGRLVQELQMGLIDKVEYWQQTKTPNWRALMARITAEAKSNPILLGGGQPAKVKPPAGQKAAPQRTPKG